MSPRNLDLGTILLYVILFVYSGYFRSSPVLMFLCVVQMVQEKVHCSEFLER